MSFRNALFLAAVASCAAISPRADADASIWQELGPGQRSDASEHAGYRQLGLDPGTRDQMRDDLRHGGTLTLPLADGGYSDFALVDSGTMHPELAAQFPEIVSLRGRDAEGRRARVDFSPLGLRAMIFDEGAVSVVEPDGFGSSRYLNFDRRDYAGAREPFVCGVAGDDPLGDASAKSRRSDAPPKTQTGQVLRTYRLAVAATGEYTAFFGGTALLGQAAIVTSINRVNEVYETDIATRLVLIANNSLLVYTNGGTDPYTNNNGGTMLGQNQTNLDTVIGSANYDVGHVFSTGGGGIASLNVPCTASKARGVTGRGSPVGDPFDIDYVAHEIGHQFNAPHTFNGTTGSCGGGNRSAGSAYEPGSGSTIMAYAGICGAEDLQPNSDPYFHAASIASVVSGFSNDSCAAQVAQTNAAPVIAPLTGKTIPMQTPFVLTASATDADGDLLTYGWEEFDLGSASPPNTDAAAVRPIFRSFNPTFDPSRTFPRLTDLLANQTTLGESLPMRSRTLVFRVTTRDQAKGDGIGATQSADVSIVVTNTAGPFALTGPAAGADWTCGQTQTATWNVANTTSAPVSCANVRLDLSDDGGVSFDHVLAASTPNDGSAEVVVPFALTADARLRATCVDNIFFAINTADFDVIDAGASLATDDTLASMLEDASTRISPVADVLGNDVRPGTVLAVSNPVGGSVALVSGAIEFTPSADFNGSASFDYVLRDPCARNSGRDTVATASFPVQAVNDAPTLAAPASITPPAGSVGAQVLADFAVASSFGPPDESGQQPAEYPTSIVSDPSAILSSVSIDVEGDLGYVLTGSAGVAEVEVRVRDDGGSANGGTDLSQPRTFTITARAAPDVAASIDNDVEFVVDGQTSGYVARFANEGVGATEDVRVRVVATSGATLGAWTCLASGGASCPSASGSGAIDELADLGPGQQLEFSVSASITAAVGESVEVTADLISDAQFIDAAGNNAATDSDPVVAIGVFADSFEAIPPP